LRWAAAKDVKIADWLFRGERKSMAEIQTGGQMLWKLEGTERVLYLRHNPDESWQPYDFYPQYVLPDPQGFSKGLATFIALLKKDWVAVES
jgi:hypothetical protein